VEVLEDRTVPSFAGPVAFSLPAAPQAVAEGHFEGAKAPLDVVTANADGIVSVLMGKGDGTLQNPINIPVGGGLTSVAVGDFNGDGPQDIVTANANGTVDVLLSNGNGTFQAPQVISIGATPDGVAVGDFNGDGRLDIVTANSNGTVTVLPGNGNGTFQAPISTTVGGRLTSLAVGEFNGDGKPDLVVGTGTGLDVLLGNGNGTFQVKSTISFLVDPSLPGITEAVTSVAVSDFRGNGKQDIVANAGDLSVLLGNGDGTFQGRVRLNTGGNVVTAFAVGDFTGDGKPDIVTSNAGDPSFDVPSLGVLAGNGDGTFQAPSTIAVGEAASALAAGDFRGDGKLDVALASGFGANNVAVLLNNGDGTFATTPSFSAGGVLPSAVAAGDFTGSGKLDLVTTGIGGDVVVLFNNGDGTFGTGPTLSDPDSPTSVVVGDFGNGHQDIAVGSEGGTIEVFLGNGDGTFQDPTVIDLGFNNSIGSLVAGDFNHDGKLDLAVTSNLLSGQTETGLVTVLLGNGNGTFRKGQAINVGTDAQGLAAAYLHGPGKLDLVTTTLLPDGSRDVKVLLNNGTGTFQKPVALTPGGRATNVAAGDFNGDGKTDLLLVDPYNDTIRVLPGNGSGSFQSPITFQLHNVVSGLGTPAVGDFFKTGKLSVAVTTGVGTVSVLQGNGDGTFQAPVNYVVGAHGNEPAQVIAADLNGNGKLDLVPTNFLSDDVSVLLNTSTPPGAAAPVATATSLTADVKAPVFGQQIDLTATVTSGAGTPTGTVTFYDGNTVLDEVALDPNGQAVLPVKLSVGAHSLRAVFAGTGAFTGSKAALSETVNKAGTKTTLSADPSLLADHLALLTATVAPVAPGAGVPTGVVTFLDGTKVVGTGLVDANGQATVFLFTLSAGKHTLTASYGGGDDFLASTSDPLTITL
jgi:hypothetical protein